MVARSSTAKPLALSQALNSDDIMEINKCFYGVFFQL